MVTAAGSLSDSAVELLPLGVNSASSAFTLCQKLLQHNAGRLQARHSRPAACCLGAPCTLAKRVSLCAIDGLPAAVMCATCQPRTSSASLMRLRWQLKYICGSRNEGRAGQAQAGSPLD